MNPRLIHSEIGHHVELSSCGKQLTTEQDVLMLIGFCGEHETHRVLIGKECLHPQVFDLTSGIAGIIFQKLSTYRIRTVLIGTWSEIESSKFQDFIRESNKGSQFRFFDTRDEAERWLLA